MNRSEKNEARFMMNKLLEAEMKKKHLINPSLHYRLAFNASDALLSHLLAIAVGWPWSWVRHDSTSAVVRLEFRGMEKKFDYKDLPLIFKVAERYDCFPQVIEISPEMTASNFNGKQIWTTDRSDSIYKHHCRTPEAAIAVHVITEFLCPKT